MGVDGGTALSGTPCDNGNVNNSGFPDQWSADCVCEDYCTADWTQGGYPGSGCDDGDPSTGNDIWWPGCICSGTGVFGCEGDTIGSGWPGMPCDDGNPITFSEVWTPYCTCEPIVDCLGMEEGSEMPGTPCDDLDPNTFNEIWSPDCGCGIYGPNVISGQVFLDQDQNGLLDATDLI
ncbi:MAG: hypothetical protein M3R08_09725, partial [Bacteroidota bacterium]|nr:hypothetical protein [Bacteroidota bacterium]